MSPKPHPMTPILDSLSHTLERLRKPSDVVKRNALVARAMRDLGALLLAPPLDVPAEPHYYTVDDYRGDPFGPGARIPFRRGSALYRACEVFAGCSNPISRRRFIELGGVERDLDRLISIGRVVQYTP